MGILAVAIFDSVGALTPTLTIPAIRQLRLQYFVAWGLLIAMFSASSCVAEFFMPSFIPGTGFLAEMIRLYFVMVGSRIVVSLYRANAKALDWI